MAKLLSVQKGDTLKVRSSDNELYVLKVSDICHNYVGNYIYMNSKYYEKFLINQHTMLL